jgi:hypothetical protein
MPGYPNAGCWQYAEGRNQERLRVGNRKEISHSQKGNTRRAIDFHEGDKIDEKALKALLRAAVTLNKSKSRS